jgi:glycosyltransferase involved in cell wall biosynthesis
MKLGVDARVLVHRPTGVARYLHGLLEQWPRFKQPGDELALFVDRPPQQPLGVTPDALRIVPTRLPGGDPVWRQWRLWRALAKRPVDVLFCPFYSAPLATTVPTVVTIHDVSFASHPEWFKWKSRLAFALAGPSARRARRVLTVSHFSAVEVVQHLGIPAGKVSVIPPGISPAMREPPDEAESRAFRDWLGHAGPYLLHLGAVHARRHVDVTVRAFARIAPRRRDLALLITGPTIAPAPDLPRLIDELQLGRRVLRREWVPEQHIRAMVAGAEALVYLSSYEGFGLPCLESIAAGTPVIALSAASLPEVLGPAAVWLNAPEPESVARAIESLHADSTRRSRLVEQGRLRSQKFEWPLAAERTFELLRTVARGE